MNRFGKYPAVVREYDRDARQCRIEIAGITDGSELLPLAEICYAIGDKSRNTEMRILPGDLVWVEFERGDERYPIIVGWRCPNVGNDTLWRRWEHENIESIADDDQRHKAGADYAVEAGSDASIDAGDTIELTAGQTIRLAVGDASILITADEIVITAGGQTITLNPAAFAAAATAIAFTQA